MDDMREGSPIGFEGSDIGREWKRHFAAELQAEAERLAGGVGPVTAAHYRMAAPPRIVEMLRPTVAPSSRDVEPRRAA